MAVGVGIGEGVPPGVSVPLGVGVGKGVGLNGLGFLLQKFGQNLGKADNLAFEFGQLGRDFFKYRHQQIIIKVGGNKALPETVCLI